MRLFVTSLMALLLATHPGAEASTVRNNRVAYGHMVPGQMMKLFQETVPGFNPDQGETWENFVKRKGAIWAPPPEGMTLSAPVVKRLRALSYATGSEECGSTPRILFLAGPAGKARLYAYEHILCDSSGLLSPEAAVDQYIDRYGMYDTKDYDRNQVIYRGVKGHYRVGVRPFTAKDGRTGVAITVLDDTIFEQYYYKWRSALRTASKLMQDRF